MSRSTTTTEATWIGSDEKKYKKVAEKDLRQFVDELTEAQRLFWANDTHALLIVLQAMDAAGKDGTIRHVMSGVNPQGCTVQAFKEPSAEELSHDFLWRSATVLPARGMIGIFNRSYYEEVLVARVHPGTLGPGEGRHREQPATEQVWHDRYEDINAFEHHLDRNGTRIVKIFLHVSRDQQKKRFLERLDDPGKNWKFSANDLAERQHWDAYQDCLRGGAERHLHHLGAVVRGAGRPQVRSPGPGRRHHRRSHRRPGPATSAGHTGRA